MKKLFWLDAYVDINDIYFMHPSLLVMFVWTNTWCLQHGITPYWTSFHRYPNDGISKSRTHQEYRAMDLSLVPSHGWTTDLIDDYDIEFYNKFKSVGALVQNEDETGYIPRPIYIHGHGRALHAHLQIRPNLKPFDGELL